jgi:hypothetical protein
MPLKPLAAPAVKKQMLGLTLWLIAFLNMQEYPDL